MNFEDAMHTCKCGGFVRDEATMQPGWKLFFVADPLKKHVRAGDRDGNFYFLNPVTGSNYLAQFTDQQRASTEWRTTL